jgi:hypothetical protein
MPIIQSEQFLSLSVGMGGATAPHAILTPPVNRITDRAWISRFIAIYPSKNLHYCHTFTNSLKNTVKVFRRHQNRHKDLHKLAPRLTVKDVKVVRVSR